MQKSNIFFLVLICVLSSYASFFGDTVHTVEVFFDRDDFWEELDLTHETEEYIMCSVVFDHADTLESVGIRLKGNSSYGHPGLKKPFHLKLDEYIDDQEHRGIERYTFNNGFKDPTFLREKLSSEIFDGLGVPCLRSTWANVYFNDEHWGFYTVVDPIDKIALNRFFGENDGNLYKGDPRGTLEWLGWSEDGYRSNYEKNTNEEEDDWSDLIEFCNFLNNSSVDDFGSFGEHFDIYSFARKWAANTFLVNLDSYQGSGHNYYLYFDSDNVARFIVWDINETFGVFTRGLAPDAVYTLPIDYVDGERPLAQRLFADYPEFNRAVNCAMHELLETTLDYDTFDARVTELSDLIRPHVYADENKMYSNELFELNLTEELSTGGFPPSAIPGLRDFVFRRTEYMESVLGPCEEVEVYGAVLINELMASNDSTIRDEAEEYDDWFELYNPSDTAVDISNWFVSDDIEEPRKWSFPDGTILLGDSYLLVWADDDPEQGDYHTNFKLSADGEQVILHSSDILGFELVDSVTFGEMPTDSSYGRYPNGSETWMICREATPDDVNYWSSAIANETKLPDEFSLYTYPNPFNSSVNIDLDGFNNELLFDIKIYDIQGNLIHSKSVNHSSDLFSWQPSQNVQSGVYLIQIIVKDKTLVDRALYVK